MHAKTHAGGKPLHASRVELLQLSPLFFYISQFYFIVIEYTFDIIESL